jgi:6-pyruvoyltetrahydropterin/6-carboxytetrahydropterin synthase
VILRVEFQFNAAHRLPLYEGPCRHTHGHNYRLLVLVEGPVDPTTGLSIDFVRVKALVKEHVLSRIDHDDLNRILDNPTAENVVMWIWDELKPHLPGLIEMHLYEMDDSAVVYRGEGSKLGSRGEPGQKAQEL